jgi:hypothetical protein
MKRATGIAVAMVLAGAVAVAVAVYHWIASRHPITVPGADTASGAGWPTQADAPADRPPLQHGTRASASSAAASRPSDTGPPGVLSKPALFLRAGPKPGALREYILAARAMPSEGGILYASRIAESCERLAALAGFDPRLAANTASAPTDGGGSSSSAVSIADAVARHWLDGCRQITPDELRHWNVLDKRSAIRDAAIPADPLVRTAAQFLDGLPANDRTALEEARLNILRSADPGLFDQFGQNVLLRSDNQGTHLYFRSRIGVTANPDVLAAIELLPCELGLRCGPLDAKVSAACLAPIGECFADRYAWVQARQLGGDPSRLDAAVERARAMAQALRSGRYDLFVPPSR